MPIGEIFPHVGTSSDQRNVGARGWELWAWCHFHSPACRMAPFLPNHSTFIFYPQASRALACVWETISAFIWKALNFRGSRIQPYSRNSPLVALFSAACSEPHMVESCGLNLIYAAWSLMCRRLFLAQETQNPSIKKPPKSEWQFHLAWNSF